MNLKNYIFENYVTILPIEESFFHQSTYVKKTKLTAQLIKLNYKRFSPFFETEFSYIQKDKELLLWFYTPLKKEKIFTIPEAYILYFNLKEKYPNNTLKFNNNYIVIEDKKLKSSYTTNNQNKSTNLIEFSKEEYKNIYKKYLPLKELINWHSLELEPKKIIYQTIEKATYPIAFLIFFTISINYFHTKQIEEKYNTLEQEYLELKNKNQIKREKQLKNQNELEKWTKFIKKEIPYTDIPKILDALHKLFSKEKLKIQKVSIVGSTLSLKVVTKQDFVEYLQKLNTLTFLKEVIIKNSSKKYNSVTYEAQIKKELNYE